MRYHRSCAVGTTKPSESILIAMPKIFHSVGAIDFDLEALSSDTCKALIAMMDADGSGQLGFEEFAELWRDLLKWLVRTGTQ